MPTTYYVMDSYCKVNGAWQNLIGTDIDDVDTQPTTLVVKNITANGTYNPNDDNADGYSQVVANVPNTYAAGDEGKVVSSGSLVSQTSATYTTNNVYDTTLINSVTVNVSGGGGGQTLEDSGWIDNYGDYTSVSGNAITLSAGGTSHTLEISPPPSVNHNHRFETGDTVKIAVKVNQVSHRLSVSMSNASSATCSSESELFSTSNGNAYAAQTGTDVLTFVRNSSYGKIVIQPINTSSVAVGANYSAALEITGISFNGTLIYGSVTAE